MKTYKYKNYEEYVSAQIKANKKKSSNVWAKEKNIKFIANHIVHRHPKLGLCHGVRQGLEQKWFMQYLSECFVTGTEIGKRFPGTNTIRWDFNKPMDGWINKFDFIYSNSFDHAYDPVKTINVWADQLVDGGLLILEYDRRQEHTGEISKSVNKVDPVSIRFKELITHVPRWIKGATVIEILDMPVVTQEWRKAIIIEVRK